MLTLRDAAVWVVRRLREAGHRAYWAGGCVRDLVMGHEPQDYDVATDARPEVVLELFPRTVPVGVSFGVVKVLVDEHAIEVATFRADGAYRDGRHPESVAFSGEEEDARRRDFTINGLFYDPIENRIIDYVDGRRDIASGIVRAIGVPEERFGEDRLRLLRAARFAARFGFGLDGPTEAAIRNMAAHVTQVSAERIRDELAKMLTGPRPAESIELLQRLGLLAVVLPEIEAMRGVAQPPEYHPEGDVFVHTLLVLRGLERPSLELAFGALLHDVGKPATFAVRERIRFDGHAELGARMAEQIGERLRLGRRQTETIAALVRDHLKFKDVRQMRASTLKRFLRQDDFSDHLELHRIDCLASHGDLSNWEFCRQKLGEFSAEAIRPPRLITGEDLIALGYRPGPVFREILDRVEDGQLEGRLTEREQALTFVREQFPVADRSSSGGK
jgi:poly(A) polymerase